MQKTIAILAGDGIGQEVMPCAVNVLNRIAEKFNHHFIFCEAKIGGSAFESYGTHFSDETKKICGQADAILLGSVGGPLHESHLPKWQQCEKNSILALRKAFNFHTNIRPVSIYPELCDISPLKNVLVNNGVDMLILRELVGGIYFGEHKRWIENKKRYALDVAEYNESQINAIAHNAFQIAKKRREKLTSVDKANVLETSKLWREVVGEIAKQYPEVQFENMLVDNCAMQIFKNPSQFDVILTSNLFGDILSDAAAALGGSLGLMASASLNEAGLGLYEPAGGSAPDIAGKNIANPIAQILSSAMLLRYSFSLHAEANAIEQAVRNVLKSGLRTSDIYIKKDETKLMGTCEMGESIVKNI